MILVVNGQGSSVSLHNFDHYKRMDIIHSTDGASAKIELTDANNKTTVIVQGDQSGVGVMEDFIGSFFDALKADNTFFFVTNVLQQALQQQAAKKQQLAEDKEAIKQGITFRGPGDNPESPDNPESNEENDKEKGGDKDGK